MHDVGVVSLCALCDSYFVVIVTQVYTDEHPTPSLGVTTHSYAAIESNLR